MNYVRLTCMKQTVGLVLIVVKKKKKKGNERIPSPIPISFISYDSLPSRRRGCFRKTFSIVSKKEEK